MPDARTVDFNEVVEHFMSTPLIPVPLPPAMEEVAKKVHERTYTLVLWKFHLPDLPPHAKPFIDEIASDAIQILPHILLGYTRTSKLLMRGVLENTLRFVYYHDHPVEFSILNEGAKWYMGMDTLFDYVKKHPNFRKSEVQFDALNKLQSLYSELSASVHGRAVRDLESRNALRALQFNIAEAKRELKLVQRCVEATNFLLSIENHDLLRKFPEQEKAFILKTFPRPARAVWQDYEAVIRRV